ncbi:MAG: hypothetical protein ACE5F6_00435 [Anaerolineae bacterium]
MDIEELFRKIYAKDAEIEKLNRPIKRKDKVIEDLKSKLKKVVSRPRVTRGPGVIYYVDWRYKAAINEVDGGYIYTVSHEPHRKQSSGHTSVRTAADACMKIRREHENKGKEERCLSAEK